MMKGGKNTGIDGAILHDCPGGNCNECPVVAFRHEGFPLC